MKRFMVIGLGRFRQRLRQPPAEATQADHHEAFHVLSPAGSPAGVEFVPR
jgi:hypothetical protein